MTSANRKKIAVIIPKYGLVGGAEGFAAELTERIARNPRYEMHVFANRWQVHSDRVYFHKVPIISFPKFLTTISFAWFTQQALAKNSFDLIHTHDRIFNADIFTMHGIPHRIWIKRIRKKGALSLFDRGTIWVEKKLIESPSCRRFMPVSQLACQVFKEEHKTVAPEKIQVMHPGIDITNYQRLDRVICRREVRRRLGIGNSELVILFVSMNFDVKGLGLLLTALAKLKADHPQNRLRLLIVGKGNQGKYLQIARQLGIEEHITFAGVVPRNILDEIYMASDIYSMLSDFDTFGMVVLEAMAASLPVIISASVGARDIVQDGVNGFVIGNTANTDDIAARICMLEKDETREKMGKEALQTALRNSWDDVAKKMESIYQELLK